MSLQFDLRSLVFVTTAIFWLVAVLLALLIKSETPIKGPREWAIGNLLTGIGLGLFGFDGMIPDLFSIAVSNFFITIGLTFYISGVRKFRGKTVSNWLILALPVFNFLQSILFTDIFQLLEVRRFLFSLTIMMGTLMLAKETLVPARRPLLIALRITFISSCVFSLIMLVRAVASLFIHQEVNLVSNSVTISVWIATGVAQISNSFGFLFMFLYKQADDLKIKISGMNRFISILAHDLRSPLGTMKSLTQEVVNAEYFGSAEREMLMAIKKSTDNTYNLLENLLEWGHNISGDMQPDKKKLSLDHLLSEVSELMEPMLRDKEIRLVRDEHQKAFVFADEQMVRTIIRNLFSNAIKYTPQNGIITLHTGESSREAWFSIDDSGEGISPGNLAKLNDSSPNYTSLGTKGEKGFGLGLSLCRILADRNLGTLTIESKLGMGTKARVSFPRHS